MAPITKALKLLAAKVPVARDLMFVANKPSWPESVTRPAEASKLGANYNTAWARTPLARAARFLSIESITRPGIKAVANPTIIGLERLNALEGPVVFAANHSSHIDTSLVLTCLPRRFRHRSIVAAGADYFFDKHWKAAFWALTINVIPIERDKVGRRSAELAARLIAEGWSLVIFPEGTRTRDGFVAPFRGGAAYLCIKGAVPVVPVHIEGTRDIMGAEASTVKPGRTRVTFGAPLTPLPDEKAREFNLRIEAAVAATADEGRTDWWEARQRAASGTTPSLQGPPDISGWRRQWLGKNAGVPRVNKRWPR